SNKGEELSRIVLRGLGLDGFFREVLGGDSLPSRKPDPAGLRLLAARLGVPAERVLLVGDTRIDAETARNAGCAFALVEWGFPKPLEMDALVADLRIGRAEDLVRALTPGTSFACLRSRCRHSASSPTTPTARPTSSTAAISTASRASSTNCSPTW